MSQESHTPESVQPLHPDSGFRRLVGLSILVICALSLLAGVVFGLQKAGNETTAAQRPEKNQASVSTFLNNQNRLLLITLSGPIFMDADQESSPFFSGDTNAVTVRKALDEAAEDKSVKGVLLRINSPGGTVAMSQELNAAVQRVSKKKPIVASLGDMAASGGYYTACATDKIVVNPGTLTGSIGVIISSMNVKNLMENKLGIRAVTFKSGKFKDILSPYREMTPPESQLIQKLINDSYQDFLGAVIKGRTRHLSSAQAAEKTAMIERIKAVADGRVVHGKEAIRAGLADEVGDLQHAYRLLDTMAKERFHIGGSDKLPLQAPNRFPTVMDMFGLTSSDATAANIPLFSSVKMAAPSYRDLMPLSMRYPNQPLWVAE